MAVVKISTKFGTTPITVDPGDVAPAYDLSATGSGAFKYGQLMFKHYKIAPSVSSNNLTVALQHLDGNDASATRPLFFMINGSLRSVTAALSITMNAGTNWMNAGAATLATKEIDYFVYIGYNATDGVVLGVSRVPYGTSYANFSTTSTADNYARISTITTAASTDPYHVIGRYAATLSAGAGYTWTVPTYTPENLIQSPITETRWLDIDAGLTGGGSLTISAYTNDIVKYKFLTDVCKYSARVQGVTTGGTAHTDINATLPMTAPDLGLPGAGQYVDGGLQLLAQIFQNTATTLRIRKDDNSNWSNASSAIQLLWNFDYPIKI